jgi:hypothetical protein
VIFGNSAEGSKTVLDQLRVLKIEDLVLSGQLLLLTGGEMESQYPYLLHDHFITHILDYDENIEAQNRADEIFTKHTKPYKFLFLNGRARSHRKYLLERFQQMNLLDQALWTMLDGRAGGSRYFTLTENGQDLLRQPTPIRHLPSEYEFEFFKDMVEYRLELEDMFFEQLDSDRNNEISINEMEDLIFPETELEILVLVHFSRKNIRNQMGATVFSLSPNAILYLIALADILVNTEEFGSNAITVLKDSINGLVVSP